MDNNVTPLVYTVDEAYFRATQIRHISISCPEMLPEISQINAIGWKAGLLSVEAVILYLIIYLQISINQA